MRLCINKEHEVIEGVVASKADVASDSQSIYPGSAKEVPPRKGIFAGSFPLQMQVDDGRD